MKSWPDEKIPRDVNGPQLVKALRILGYAVNRQKGSHICVTTQQHGEHHEVVPNHRPIKVGTLADILKSVASHHGLTVEELLAKLEL
jgi:predicted RNA binding protein YcfA (HicA-like mRNA interferase family)